MLEGGGAPVSPLWQKARIILKWRELPQLLKLFLHFSVLRIGTLKIWNFCYPEIGFIISGFHLTSENFLIRILILCKYSTLWTSE